MFSGRPNHSQSESFSKSRKIGRSRNSFREHAISKQRHERTRKPPGDEKQAIGRTLTSPIITLIVGHEQRLFAAHEDILCLSPFFQAACRGKFLEAQSKRIALSDEEPEIFSSVLEYLYKGDYYPRLVYNKRKESWELDSGVDSGHETSESTVYHHGAEGELLKDTVIYCAAEKYGLEELKRVALRKQGLQSGIQCSTILSSARFAYANTPDTDSKLRAHYLAMIIRSRSTFKRSGTMQLEMYAGGSQLFFDLFVAMANHIDDVATVAEFVIPNYCWNTLITCGNVAHPPGACDISRACLHNLTMENDSSPWVLFSPRQSLI